MNTKIENIVICGIGAAGSNTFLHLLYAYPAMNYTVVDFDKIENRNFEAGTQPYSKVDLNRPKTQAIQRIAYLLKNKKIDISNIEIKEKQDIKNIVKDPKSTIIIDAFDNAKSRNLFLPLKDYNILHIGFSAGMSGEAVWNDVFEPMVHSDRDKDIDICETTIARPFIFALTSLAALVISEFIEQSTKTNIYFDKYMNIKRF